MAGVFLKQIKAFNRAHAPVTVLFDGETKTIPVGFIDLPEMVKYHAKNQNPIMGSGDPNDPTVRGTRYLVVFENEEGYGVPLTEDEWNEHLGRPCRWDEEAAFRERYGDDPKARLVKRGVKNSSTARNRYEAGQAPGGTAEFTRKEA